MVHRFGVTVYLVTQQELSFANFLRGTSFLMLLLTISQASGSSWTTLEIKGLLNSWESVLRSIEEVTEKPIEILSNAQLGLKIITLACMGQLAAVNVAAFCLVFEDLPVSVFPTFKLLGLIPETSLPTILWQIGFFPFEFLIVVPPMLAATFTASVIRQGQAVLRLYANCLRLVFLF